MTTIPGTNQYGKTKHTQFNQFGGGIIRKNK